MADRWDEYLIPGTKVLRNLVDVSPDQPFGTPDQARLDQVEDDRTSVRLAALAQHPELRAETYDDMKAIHRFLFETVYPFAGQERFAPVERTMKKLAPDVVNFSALDPDAPVIGYHYYPAEHIAQGCAIQYAALAGENYLRRLPKDQFVDRLAHHWATINQIHAFREGNTRTQFVFFQTLARKAGYELDSPLYKKWGPLRREFIRARYYHQATGSHDRLRDVLDKGIRTIVRPPEAAADFQSQRDRLRARAERARAESLRADPAKKERDHAPRYDPPRPPQPRPPQF